MILALACIWLLGCVVTLTLYWLNRNLVPPQRWEWAWAVVVSVLWFVVIPGLVLKANLSRRD